MQTHGCLIHGCIQEFWKKWNEFSEESKKTKKKIFATNFNRNSCFSIFFSVFLESFETYADPSLSEIRAKLNFSSKMSQKPRNENFIKQKNSEISFWIRFRILRIFWDQKLNLTTFGGGRVSGLHAVL